MSFSYQMGDSNPGTEAISVHSTGVAFNFSATAAGGNWLTVTPPNGTTHGTLYITANPTGLATGTYNGSISITSAGASNSPQVVPVTLVVSGGTAGTIRLSTTNIAFFWERGEGQPSTRNIRVRSSGGPVNFTAATFGADWLSVSPSGGSTPGAISISVNPSALAQGKYTGQVQVTPSGGSPLNISVLLVVVNDSEGGDDKWHVNPHQVSMGVNGTPSAQWIQGVGLPTLDARDPGAEGLVLSVNSALDATDLAADESPARRSAMVPMKPLASAGATITHTEGISLVEMGYDIRDGSTCTATAPRFVVQTADGVAHTVGGCAKGAAQPAPAAGWTRLRFDVTDPEQAFPPIAPGSSVSTIRIVLEQSTAANTVRSGGFAVLDNLDINGTFIGHQ